jgi:16S rRNA pseudouridine516 synthase
MRLDKYITQASSLTRSQAKKAISKGLISNANGPIRSSAYKVAADETLYLDGQALSLRGPRYIMLNKPQAFICSTVDEQLPSVLNLLDIDKREQLFIAGRLDADTTGLTLITDNGQWSHQVTSPRRKCNKRYRVTLAEPLPENTAELFAAGIQLKNEPQPCKPATLETLSETEALLTISEGKYHQVKRMFAALGNRVTALHREQIGGIELDPELDLGEWRYLTDKEINAIKQ